ncbi:hypothetical protein ACFQY5_07200 [Paeniroseomonas aquatica]|uniref:AfsR/SARP family transcriptional regulator n=1 Tax=Paeniroseomonas aquatica TaxID=373043 RepID=UPI00361DDC2A
MEELSQPISAVAPGFSPPATLLVSVFGPVRAVMAVKELRLRSRKARALLGYLLLTDGGEESRERLVGLLWSEAGEAKARASLRQVVHELREALEAVGCHALRAGRLSVSLHGTAIAADSGRCCRWRNAAPCILAAGHAAAERGAAAGPRGSGPGLPRLAAGDAPELSRPADPCARDRDAPARPAARPPPAPGRGHPQARPDP